ncbi:segmentation polarity homeobox protein engrailed-like [Haliotis rubra]|uniref:segmentation polarity homeobox protein engrailed-like n=1 Tax=Haliotis rubra TaxID=36100 RepID=UPI001EE5293C|nr:segmentation polarity homeobox protein engrailed-like [Haliotis rubra]
MANEQLEYKFIPTSRRGGCAEAVPTPSGSVFQGPTNTLSSEAQRAPPRRRVPFSIEDIMKSDDVQTSEPSITDRTSLTKPEAACEGFIATTNPQGFGGLKLEHLLRCQIPESPQTSKVDGKLSHPYRCYLQNKIERCEIPAFPVSLHHLQSYPELPLSLQTRTDTPPTISLPVSLCPSHVEQLDVRILKTSTLPSSSDAYADDLIDVESASPNGSTASSGFYSNSSPTHSADSSSLSGRISTGTQDDRGSPKGQEEDHVSVETSSITEEEEIVSELSSPKTLEEDCVSANPRKNYNEKQARRLKQVFLENKYPDVELYEDLSQELNIPVKRLKVWFQNRRSRNKRTSDTKMMNYPLQQQNMAAMLSSAPGYGYTPPMMHQPMYQYPAPNVPMMYPPSLYPGYPYPFHYQQ